MASSADFQKGFDELLDNILTDYRNQELKDEKGDTIAVDTSQGTLIFIKSACMASALWGLYNYQRWISDQIFPDVADTENLEHHAYIWSITRTYGETDSSLLARLLDRIQRPPAGGNKYDYVKWALEVDNVQAAYCLPSGQGIGTVDVIILANEATTGSEVPDQTLIDAVKAHIDDVRPVTAKAAFVRGPVIVTQGVTVVMAGDDADPETADTEITAYLNALEPGQTLYRSQIIAIGMSNGATNVTVSAPAADVTVQPYEMIRAGVVSVA